MLGGGNRGRGVGNEPSRSLRGSGVVARLLRSELSAEHLSFPGSVPARETLPIRRGPARSRAGAPAEKARSPRAIRLAVEPRAGLARLKGTETIDHDLMQRVRTRERGLRGTDIGVTPLLGDIRGSCPPAGRVCGPRRCLRNSMTSEARDVRAVVLGAAARRCSGKRTLEGLAQGDLGQGSTAGRGTPSVPS